MRDAAETRQAVRAAREIAEACAKKGVRMIDAPVSGGEPKAVDGTLSIMVGGDKAAIPGFPSF